jgi:hypothetical protein
MSQEEGSVKNQQTEGVSSLDSFHMPVKKSPLMWFALLQIPIVLFMVLMMWLLYQSQFS